MTNNHYYCIIMAGGIGSRFWPISREAKPKQFLNLSRSRKSFLRLAYERFAKIIPPENIIVSSQSRYKELVKKEIPEISDENLFLEPYSRNTAPCLAYATYKLLKRDPKAVMIATPADHLIYDDELFKDTILKALDYASCHDSLMTLGVVPNGPDTNFGYIQVCSDVETPKGEPVKVKTFTEKPDKELAEVFYQSGEFYWNSGIFVWQANIIRAELEKHQPEITTLFSGWEKALDSPEEEAFIEKAFAGCMKISIDYAVMEKTDKAWLVPADFEWHDIGNWEALHSYRSKKDLDGNALKAHKILNKDTKNTLIYSDEDNKLVVIRGLDNFIVVDTDDVLMICPRDDKQLKEIITEIAMPDYEEYR